MVPNVRRHAATASAMRGSDGGKERMVNHRQAQHPERMMAQHRPVRNNEQKSRTGKRSEEHEDAEVPDLIGIDAKFARDMEGEHECEKHSNCGGCAVRRNDKRTDMKENGMHLSKHRAFK